MFVKPPALFGFFLIGFFLLMPLYIVGALLRGVGGLLRFLVVSTLYPFARLTIGERKETWHIAAWLQNCPYCGVLDPCHDFDDAPTDAPTYIADPPDDGDPKP